MPYFNKIMPREIRTTTTHAVAMTAAPYPQAATSAHRTAAIWSTSDDEILLRARASGLNWQPIASKHFPNKTANACRKRHERLIERRNVEDWDNEKLELLAQEYLACRKEMWEVLASRLGERWNIVEAKCMEKGLKTLQTTVRKASAERNQAAYDDHGGIHDHNSDSGFLGSGSEAEMEVDENMPIRTNPATRTNTLPKHGASASWSEASGRAQQLHNDNMRSRSLPIPHPLPLYQPPPPRIRTQMQPASNGSISASPAETNFPQRPSFPSIITRRYEGEKVQRGGISIQSVLAPAEPQNAAAVPAPQGYEDARRPRHEYQQRYYRE